VIPIPHIVFYISHTLLYQINIASDSSAAIHLCGIRDGRPQGVLAASFKKLNEERNNSIEVSDDFIVYSNPFLMRVFVFENITNENELDKFIKDNYGSECFINNKLQWN